MPWRGPLGGDPLETLPGPNNPWLACTGEGIARASERSENDPKLPAFVLPTDGSLTVDWKKIDTGFTMMSAGALTIVTAIVGGIAVAATLPTSGVGTAAGVLTSTVAITLAAGGSILMGAGNATVIGGIDPKISDYKKHVPAVPTRKLALPADLPPAAMTFMQAACEIERLSTAETDIIDHARAAAKANDKSWTELHLRDLHHVQHGKQHFVGKLATVLREINEDFANEFDQARVDPDEPVRDLINPLIEMRGSLDEVASLSSAEINNMLGIVRVPSPMSVAMEETVGRLANKAQGQPSELINLAIDQLERLNVIDHEAFDVKQAQSHVSCAPERAL